MNPKGMGSSDGTDARPQMGSAGFFQHQQHQHQQQHPTGLPRLPSVYSLTFDEFQTAVGGPGKDFGSMNMDELIKSIWSAEEMHAMASATTTAAVAPLAEASGVGSSLQREGSLKLPRTLSQKTVDEVWRDLFNETGAAGAVAATVGGGHWPAGGSLQVQQRQPTLGEMTLEEFLVRVGVVRDDTAQQQPAAASIVNAINASSGSTASAARTTGGAGVSAMFYPGADLSPSKNVDSSVGLGLGINQPIDSESPLPLSQLTVSPNTSAANLTLNTVGAGLQQSYSPPLHPASNNPAFRNPTQGMAAGGMVGMATNPIVNSAIIPRTIGLGTTGVTVAATAASPPKHLAPDVCPKSSGEMSSISPTPYAFNMGITKKRTGVEKVIERRQRRMIKNRESAARSRARKQAYTMELEAEVAKLKQQNQELQNKQAEMVELQKTQMSSLEANGSIEPQKHALKNA